MSTTRTYTLSTPYSEVTDRIVAALERGVAPWVCPWDRSGGKPRNGTSSGRPSKGINAVMTGMAGYGDPRWFTFKQAHGLGGQVKKGEKGTPIVFYQFADRRGGSVSATAGGDADGDGQQVEHQGAKSTRSIPFARIYWVWHWSQITWAPTAPMASPAVVEPVPTASWEMAAKGFVEAIGASTAHGGTRACYMPSEDRMSPESVILSGSAATLDERAGRVMVGALTDCLAS